MSDWEISPWSGGEGHARGFYVSRRIDGRTEWLKTSDGKAARKFNSEDAARKAIARINSAADVLLAALKRDSEHYTPEPGYRPLGEVITDFERSNSGEL